MINDNHHWDFIPLSMVLPTTITQYIHAYPLPLPCSSSSPSLNDDHVWNHHASICSVKSSYHSLLSLLNGGPRRTTETCSWIWKFKIPPKIKLFVWKCAHHHIPTKLVIFPHADLNAQLCPRCTDIETPIHAPRDCSFARYIWSSFSPHLIISDFFRLDLHTWCKTNSKITTFSCYIPWNIIFAFTIWTIWLSRNSLIFTRKLIPHHILKQNAISHATEFFFLSSVSAWHPSSSSPTTLTRWCLAPLPHVTINTDGSSKGNPGMSSAGGVARSAAGEWLWNFSLHL